VVRKQVPDLQEYFSFDRSYFFQTHFDDAGWFAIRIYPRRDSGVTTGPRIDDADVLYLKSKELRQQISFGELTSLLGADWLSEDRFTYIGPCKDGSVSWESIKVHAITWLNELVLRKTLERNRDRVLRAVPQPPNFDIAAIFGAMWVLECETVCIQGTAFALSNVGLVTCAHALGADTHAFRFEKPDRKFKTKVLRSHDVIDLAVLEIDTELHYLRAGDPNALKLMDHLLVAGHPNYRLGDSPFVSPGLLIGWRMKSGIRRLMTNAPIVTGTSGGPVLDREGLVVGIAVTGAERFSQAGQTEDHGIIPIDALDLLTR
jgi:hypothetical protein